MRKKALKKSRFTLIELLVVIGIIGILVGILLPAIASSIKEGKKTAGQAQVKQIALAIAKYKSEYMAYPSTLTTETDTSWAWFDSDIASILKGNNARNIVFYRGEDKDPWEGRIAIYMDVDFNGTMTFYNHNPYPSSGGTVTISDEAAAWCQFPGNDSLLQSWD